MIFNVFILFSLAFTRCTSMMTCPSCDSGVTRILRIRQLLCGLRPTLITSSGFTSVLFDATAQTWFELGTRIHMQRFTMNSHVMCGTNVFQLLLGKPAPYPRKKHSTENTVSSSSTKSSSEANTSSSFSAKSDNARGTLSSATSTSSLPYKCRVAYKEMPSLSAPDSISTSTHTTSDPLFIKPDPDWTPRRAYHSGNTPGSIDFSAYQQK